MADAVEAVPPPPEFGGLESGRSSPSPAASPEFEFWMVGKNPSPSLLTADELFSGGVVLPLHTLAGGSESAALEPPPAEEEAGEEEEEAAQPLAESGITPTPDLPAVTFKWKDIFKAKERKKTERRVSSVSGNAELININIWPFSRSRSAGHSAGGALSNKAKPSPPSVVTPACAAVSSAPAQAAPARKVSSAPCSRSNSRGESAPEPTPAVANVIPPAAAAVAEAAGTTTSMLRRLVPGHSRTNNNNTGAGIRLGRPSPVWQLRRNKLQQAGAKKKAAAAAAPAPVVGVDDIAAAASAAVGCRNNAEGGEEGPDPPQGLFGLRTFFSKKVY